MTAQDWLDTAQAAERVKRHPVTVRRAAESGVLHGHQTGFRGRWQFEPACVDAWRYGHNSAAACGCARLRMKRTG